MKNISELTDELGTAFERLRDDSEYVSQATELANIAGKMINAQKVQLEYAAAKGVEPEIAFLETTKAVKR